MKKLREKLGMTKGDLVVCLSTVIITGTIATSVTWFLSKDTLITSVVGFWFFVFGIPFGLLTYPTEQNDYGQGLY